MTVASDYLESLLKEDEYRRIICLALVEYIQTNVVMFISLKECTNHLLSQEGQGRVTKMIANPEVRSYMMQIVRQLISLWKKMGAIEKYNNKTFKIIDRSKLVLPKYYSSASPSGF